MSLPNVNITLGNGNMGAISLSDDGIAALIVTGKEVTDKLKLKKVYVLASAQDLKQLGVDETNNPLVCKEVNGFYTAAGEGAELHLMVVSEATTLTHMCTEDEDGDSPMKMLINSAAGRIRLVGINRNPPQDYVPTVSDNLDKDAITAMAAAHSVAESYLAEIAPFRVLVPALGWNGETEGLYQPREGSYNRVAVVLASDGVFGNSNYYSAAIGQVLGRAAKISVQQNLGRVRDGAIAAEGCLTDGSTPEEHYSVWNLLDDAGYIFYRTFIGKNGYYLNGDHMAAPVSDDYGYLSLGRTVDKAVVIAYQTYIDDILDNIVVDENGSLPVAICKNFEASIIRAVNTSMSDEISSFSAYIDPNQNVLANGKIEISCQIVPMGTLRQININLSLNNPTEQAMATTFNSNEYAWVDVRVALLGREVTGLRGIEYKVKHQKEALYATGKKARSIQKGKKEYEGTITLLQSELIALDRAAQEKNYEDITDIDFDVVVTYISENNVVTTDKIVNVSITEIPRGIKEGDLQQEIALTFIALDVESNVA